MNDQLTPAERTGQPDCLVEMATAWLHRPLGGQTEAERAEAIDEICLLISQMRHTKLMETEWSRWIERVTVRLCQQSGATRCAEWPVQVELRRRVTVALLQYHDWRERVAPKFTPSIATGPSEGGDILA